MKFQKQAAIKILMTAFGIKFSNNIYFV